MPFENYSNGIYILDIVALIGIHFVLLKKTIRYFEQKHFVLRIIISD